MNIVKHSDEHNGNIVKNPGLGKGSNILQTSTEYSGISYIQGAAVSGAAAFRITGLWCQLSSTTHMVVSVLIFVSR